jgi:nuclease S1
MNPARWTSLAIAAFLTLSVAPDASAWGPEGHRIVCRIAFQLLDTPRQQEIIRLTSTYRRPNNGPGFAFFTDGCVFADEARDKARQPNPVAGWEKFAPFESWHFLNVPRTTRLVAESHCNNNCVLTGIARHTDLLRTSKSDEDRAEAIFFLGHWVGDIHQPLHISYSDDLGGNNIKPITSKVYTSGSMHGVWDSGILSQTVGPEGWRLFADRLAREVTPAENDTWIASQPLAWAQESYVLTTRPATQYCTWRVTAGTPSCARIPQGRTLEQPYQNEFRDDVSVRLQQAGARLADLLRRHLVVAS